MNKVVMGIGIGIASAAVGAYMMMPSRQKRRVKRGLQETVDDIRDVAEDITEV